MLYYSYTVTLALIYLSSILSLFDTSRYHRCLAFFRTVYVSLSEICSPVSVWPLFVSLASLCCVVDTSMSRLFIQYRVKISFSYIVTVLILIVGQTSEPCRLQGSLWPAALQGSGQTTSLTSTPALLALSAVHCSFLSGFRTEFLLWLQSNFPNRLCCNCNICTFPCWKLTINYLNIV